MRHWSCESNLKKNDKYKRKIKVISKRMLNLEKDIQEIKMKNITPLLSTKNSTKNLTIINKFDKNEKKIQYLSISNSNSKNMNIKEEKVHYISNSISNLDHLNKPNRKRHCCQCSLRNNKQKYFSLNSSNTNFHNNHHIRKYKEIILSKEELEYEYEIRSLKRKIEELKKKNEKINNKLFQLKEKNDNLEYNINSYRNVYENINNLGNEEFKNSNTSDQINIMKYKRQLIDKVMDIYKTNMLNYDFISDKKSKENYSILNMLLSLMDIKLLYENILLNDAFLMGVDLLYQTNFPKYLSLKGKDKIIKYTNDLLSQQKKLEMEKHKYENIEKYFILHQKFAGIKNLDEFLKYIIMEIIKDNQKINKIKKV